MAQKRCKIGLALGGGAARGIAYIGILQELDDAGIPVDCIAGTSSGAIIGAIYASGVSLQEMQELALKVKYHEIITLCPTLRSLVSGKQLVRFLEKCCRVSRLEDLQIPLSVVMSDFETGQSVACTEGELFPAVQASCSIPLVFPPVTINGRRYFDGGFAAQIPVVQARALGAEIVIACDVNYRAPWSANPSNFVTILVHLMKLVAKNSARQAKKSADLVINVDVSRISLIALNQGQELIARGRQATKAVLPVLQKCIQERWG